MGADSGCWRLVGVALKNRGGHDRIRSGSVAEWLKAHDSKSCGLQSLGGSNPLASATAPEAVFFGSGSRALRSMRILSLPPSPWGYFFIHGIINLEV